MVYKESEYTVDEVLFVFYEYFKAYEDFWDTHIRQSGLDRLRTSSMPCRTLTL